MEVIDNDNKNQSKSTDPEPFHHWEKNYGRSKFFGGLIIVGVGCLFLAREMGAMIPSWVFTWQMLLIVVGVYSGIKHAFRSAGWLIMILIGSAFLVRDFMPEYDFSHYMWPSALIIVGLFVMLRPRSMYRRRWNRWHRRGYYGDRSAMWQQQTESREDFLDISSVFGSVKKNIITKNFAGGEINCVFGGAEINLSQADFNGTITLEINQVFGGTRLIVPAHWEIKSELTAVLGNVDDKRMLRTDVKSDGSKVLILKGSAVFGGIEIQSY